MDNYQKFPKISRLSRECIITEKIDGTNAQIYIKKFHPQDQLRIDDYIYYEFINTKDELFGVAAGSRSRWIKPGKDDNHGFARWVRENAWHLLKLGEGSHFGEWWGKGINRGYDMKEKRFSLFNTKRWSGIETRPECCGCVPVLYRGPFLTEVIEDYIETLKSKGSIVAPGYMRPEGIVIYHTAANTMFKKTIEGDFHKNEDVKEN